MKKPTIDEKLIIRLTAEITNSIEQITKTFSKENEAILKHLAAASIHLTFFLREFHDMSTAEQTKRNDVLEALFLNTCGCDFHGIKQ